MVARATRKASMPAGMVDPYEPYVIDRPGRYFILSDVHIPGHNLRFIERQVREAKRQGMVGVILNGDILDQHDISRHNKDPRAPKYVKEIEIGRKFLAYIRSEFPKADLIFKEGNHEERIEPYLIESAPALWGLPGVNLESWLEADKYGYRYIRDKRIGYLGKLNVLHGHEIKGIVAGNRPAEGLWKRTLAPSICGHFHRSDEYDAHTIRGVPLAAWTTGCACNLDPRWMRHNRWNLGCARVELYKDGTFNVDNVRIRKGVAA